MPVIAKKKCSKPEIGKKANIYIIIFLISELTVIDCDKAKCDVVFAPKCPADSIAIQSASQQGKCCPGPYKCQCKSCLSAQLTACRNDQVAVQVSRGTGKPGHCCDVFQCVDKGM